MARSIHQRRLRTSWRTDVLFLTLLLMCVTTRFVATAAAVTTDGDAAFVIDANTKLHDIFQCSPVKPIGFYNEYFVSCTFAVPAPLNTTALTSLVVRNVVLDAAQLAPYTPVHVELLFALNTTIATVTLDNSSIRASAIDVSASAIIIDATASVNVTARGLKFGPGFNSRVDMGGSHGGIGGASLTLLHQSCDRIPPNTFFRAIGDVAGDVSDFQGYGSGGGNDNARGGGRIRLTATHDVVLNGSVLANGGAACTDCSDSAGAGGTVVVTAGGRIVGTGVVRASGGEPALFDSSAALFGAGGGGGGGGGRIVLDARSAEELDPSHVEAFGGGASIQKLQQRPPNPLIQWCQLGGDGTILKVQHAAQQQDNNDPVDPPPPRPTIATLVIKGGRLQHEGPVTRIQLFGCTPIFVAVSAWQQFLPDAVAHIFISGGATVCASYVRLQLDAGSQVNALEGNRSVQLVASQLTLQGFVGPSTQSERDLFVLLLDASDVSISNGLLLVDLLDVAATNAFTLDKFSVAKFRFGIAVQTGKATTIEGFLQPLDPLDDDDDAPFIRLESSGNVTLRPQPAQLGTLAIVVQASDTAVVAMPLDASVLRLSVAAANATVVSATSGPLRQCAAFSHQSDVHACEALSPSSSSLSSQSPYAVSVFAKRVAQLGNVSAGSILLCSDDAVLVDGTISTHALGCGAGAGPGNSSVVHGASGGAGHGGRGGNVQPGNTGGGAAYDAATSLWPLGNSDTDTDEHKWPLWPGSGASSGDTPDEIVGGSGGGVVYVGARKLDVRTGATISVRGGDGSKRGGGGAGGSMALSIAELAGGGVLDIGGGEAVNPSSGHDIAAAPTTASSMSKVSVWSSNERPLDVLTVVAADVKRFGGGGGGGVIRISYLDGHDAAKNGEQFVHDGGKLLVQGGRSVGGGESGGVGVTAASNCDAGRGDVLCLPCTEGSYSPRVQSKCLPCEPGSCANHTGASECDLCAAGSFNSEFGKTQCTACAVGHFAATTGAKACVPCGPGHFAEHTGAAMCALCPIGAIATALGSSNCTVCGIGETTTAVGATVCVLCHVKPAHSAFNVRGNCTYACDKGRTGLDCLTPFERLVKPIGGPLGFVLLVFSALGVVFGAWGFLSYRSAQHQKRRFAEYKAQTLRDELSLAKLTRHLTPRLIDQDLDALLARLYFAGENHLESSWTLSATYLPVAMREIVIEGLYLSFATTCNALLRWDRASWEAWTYRLLVCTVTPLGTLFKRRRQLRRVEKLAKFVEDHGASFFREMNFRVHGAKLKIGFSADFSLAYLDVLVPPIGSAMSLLDARPSGCVTIVVAGSGSFFRPFHIDTNDICVRAVPARLELLQHDFWITFVADVNAQLRIVSPPTAQARVAASRRAVRALVAFVDVFNARHESAGVHVAFGYFAVDAALHAASNDECFTEWDVARIDDVLAAFNDEPFKFAFQVTKHSEPASIGKRDTRRGDDAMGDAAAALAEEEDGDALAHTPPRSLTPHRQNQHHHFHRHSSSSRRPSIGRDDWTSDPRPADFRFSQIRMEALFANDNRHDHAADARSPRDDAEPHHTLLSPTSKKRRSSHDSGTTRSTATNVLAALVSQASVQRVLALLAPIAPLYRLEHVAAPRVVRPRLLPVALLLLLVLDVALVFWILMEYYCIQIEDPTATDSGCSRTALWSVVWLLPGAILGAPTLGLVFVARKSVFYGKLFAVWNVAANVNALVAFACGVAFWTHVREGVLGVVLALVCVKFAEKQLALRCMAQYAAERPLRGWRGLYTTKDWYDSAYTPLVYHES